MPACFSICSQCRLIFLRSEYTLARASSSTDEKVLDESAHRARRSWVRAACWRGRQGAPPARRKTIGTVWAPGHAHPLWRAWRLFLHAPSPKVRQAGRSYVVSGPILPRPACAHVRRLSFKSSVRSLRAQASVDIKARARYLYSALWLKAAAHQIARVLYCSRVAVCWRGPLLLDNSLLQEHGCPRPSTSLKSMLSRLLWES